MHIKTQMRRIINKEYQIDTRLFNDKEYRSLNKRFEGKTIGRSL
jgi:hypothetical protein